MSTAEVLLTLIIALVVFGPSKLPMLAKHLAKVTRLAQTYQQALSNFWQAQLNQQQLEENDKKARKADIQYQNQHHDAS